MELQHGNILLRDATKADAKQLAEWWNNGAVMAHAGFPNGLGTSEEKVAEDIGAGALIIEEAGKPIGEANYRIVDDKVAEIGIKICVFNCQNRGIGKIVLSMLIRYLFDNGFYKIVLDTNLENKRAQRVYESLGFRNVRVNIDSWTDQVGKLQSSVEYEVVEKDFVDYAGE